MLIAGRLAAPAGVPAGARIDLMPARLDYETARRQLEAEPSSPPLEPLTSERPAAFSPDGSRIVTASSDGTARVWDTATGHLRSTLSGHEWWLASARYSPNGKLIVTASGDKSAIVWDAATAKPLGRLSGDGHQVDDAHFSKDGSRIITSLRDGEGAQIWDTATGKHIATFPDSRHQAKFARLCV